MSLQTVELGDSELITLYFREDDTDSVGPEKKPSAGWRLKFSTQRAGGLLAEASLQSPPAFKAPAIWHSQFLLLAVVRNTAFCVT